MSTAALLVSVFGVIFVAELPDKTALATLVLATREKAWIVFTASATALALQSVIAVAAGGLLSALPPRPIAIATGAVFLVSACVMWWKKEEGGQAVPSAPLVTRSTLAPSGARSGDLRAFLRAFAIVFAAEWGDLTQIGTGALAARYGRPLVVLLGATLALWCVAGLAVFIGHRAQRAIHPGVVQRIAAVVFAVVGVVVVWGAL